MGYEADIGYMDASYIAIFSEVFPQDIYGLYPLWGCLVDENRSVTCRHPRHDIFPAVILKVADQQLMEKTIHPWDWNEIQITALRPEIEIKINGVPTAKYTEKGEVPLSGSICLQAHSGGPYEVWYKDIRVRPL